MHVLMSVILVVSSPMGGEICEHADAILAHQLEDGAIVHVENGDEITIEPYFANYSALGLFEAYRLTREQKYLDAGIAWMDWYFKHMGANGAVCNYAGTRADYRPTVLSESTDATAATFLMCANMRRLLTRDLRYILREQSNLWKTYMLMVSTADVDGLTYAKADYPHKFTMNNAEVYEGMWHARQIARTLRDYSWNRRVYYARHKLEDGFAGLRGPDAFYAWGETNTGAALTTAQAADFYPAGVANLAAVALGPVKKCKARKTLDATYQRYPEIGACAPDHLYWWVAAAVRVNRRQIGQQALEAFRQKADERGLAVDHALYIRALSLVHMGRPNWPGVPMGSTFAHAPRQAVR
ncbi:MAG: hypothetical protein JXR94_03210 [Candidatus Hydrogenedentes bacterium]|nr:hypothetical protein [Candidatus Hydrogenedentota bacterium]